MQRRRTFLLLRTDQPHVVELGCAPPSARRLSEHRLCPLALAVGRHGGPATGRVRAMSAEVRIRLRHQRERSGSCPDLRKFRIIAVRRWSGFAYRLTVMLV